MNTQISKRQWLFILSLFLFLSSFAKTDRDSNVVEDSLLSIVGKKKVSAVEGTIQELFIHKQLPEEQVLGVREQSDALLMLKSRKADFILCNIGNAATFMNQDSTLTIAPIKLLSTSTCFGISKDNPSLLTQLNKFIADLVQSGEAKAIREKWFTKFDQGEMPQYDFSKAQKTLRIGSGCMSPPYTFIVNEKHVGIDIDILFRFANAMGYRPEIINMPFGSLLAAIQTGQVDIIANSLSPTEERKKKINFTEPYTVIYSVLLKLKEDTNQAIPSNQSWWESVQAGIKNNLIVEKRYMLILNGLKETILISALSILLGTLLGGIICFCRMNKRKALNIFSKGYINLIRGIPVLVFLMILFYVVFVQTPLNATTVAAIAFGMNFSAYVSEMFRTSIEAVPLGQTEAGLSLGFSPIQTFCLIIAPQAFKSVLPVYKGECISLIKTTSIVGYIAVQDLTKATDIIRSRTFDAFFPLIVAAIIYFILAWGIGKLLDRLDHSRKEVK